MTKQPCTVTQWWKSSEPARIPGKMQRRMQWRPPGTRCGICASQKVVKTDMTVKDGKVQTYRARGPLSLKYES